MRGIFEMGDFVMVLRGEVLEGILASVLVIHRNGARGSLREQVPMILSDDDHLCSTAALCIGTWGQ